MIKNKYIYKYKDKDITMIVYSSNKRWANYVIEQLYYYTISGMYKFGDMVKGNNTKMYYLNFEDCGYNVEFEIKADEFVKATKKVNRLYELMLDTNKKPDEIMKMEVIKYEQI